MLEQLVTEEWLGYNAKLQQKKNSLRKLLKKKGVLKKEGTNNFDKYKYFTEAQYKQLFTELFAETGLELKFDEIEYSTFTGSEKQSNGRMVKVLFTLIDTETGFYETTSITGEGIDKGDKAGYKAYTGALKYYLADTFMVATGDDAEKESPSEKMNDKVQKKATEKQVAILEEMCNEEEIAKLKTFYHIDKVADLTITQASNLIAKKRKVK